ncbi:MAG TPA: hypothetical protein VD788_12690 [Candidatus Polarisedimenticolaceae bacterium]|nr:hypothetical protein [Candidatus Polarisedimenticolaceae bacterium]
MRLSRSFPATAVLLLACCLPCPTSSAAEPTETEAVGPNVRITLTVGDVDPGAQPVVRTYRLLTRDGGEPSRMLMGWRTPIPMSKGAGDELSYVYQNVGMTAQIRTTVRAGGTVLVSGEVEISGARQAIEGMQIPPHLPVIGTFQQDLSVSLEPGKPLRVAEVPDPEGGTMYLELTAEVLDR